ncbi:MAG: hypothetical protein ACERKK_11145 [Poseidonibacter sp.]|uniref:hypothetical protein n=1 Tax=Poseidonibacter sp. TaxID=2321188 RepID=UPI00359CE737
MIYNEYFTTEDESYLFSKENGFKYKYHVVVTFPNIVSIDNYIDALYEHLNTNSFFIYAWHCTTKRKYKKPSNPHPRKKHLHLILFSNSEFNFIKYDTTITSIYNLSGLLEYIHDGHHIIHKKYFNIKSSVFREKLTNLRISNN